MELDFLPVGNPNIYFNPKIFDSEGKKCAEGLMTYYLYPLAVAIRKFGYPGVDAFYE